MTPNTRQPRRSAPECIVVTLTQGNIDNNHIYLSGHLDFFPGDAIGAPNRHDGLGTPLRLHFDGLADTVETDIPSDKKFFRDRASVGEFFTRHSLHGGDQVGIERLAAREYHIMPLQEAGTP
jgi:hypothetical protein